MAPLAPAGTAAARPSVMQLVFREKGALYAAYMPVLTDGGLFVPTTRDYKLGEDIYLLLSLPDDPQRYPVAGKVAWITPANASGGRTQGVGVRFPADEKTRTLKLRIEEDPGNGHFIVQAHADDLSCAGPIPGGALTMFVDSHCHLSFPELRAQIDQVLLDMGSAQRGACLVHLHDGRRVRHRARPGDVARRCVVCHGGRSSRFRRRVRAHGGRPGRAQPHGHVSWASAKPGSTTTASTGAASTTWPGSASVFGCTSVRPRRPGLPLVVHTRSSSG